MTATATTTDNYADGDADKADDAGNADNADDADDVDRCHNSSASFNHDGKSNDITIN